LWWSTMTNGNANIAKCFGYFMAADTHEANRVVVTTGGPGRVVRLK
jgi:hypothetical protein